MARRNEPAHSPALNCRGRDAHQASHGTDTAELGDNTRCNVGFGHHVRTYRLFSYKSQRGIRTEFNEFLDTMR